MEHLDKTMTEYVFQEGIPSNTDSQFADKVMAYANFLSETLNPSMFVPAVFEDGKWVILEEPKEHKYCKENEQGLFIDDSRKYKSALENVYFEGFYVCNRLESVKCVTNGDLHLSYEKAIERNETIESLISYKLKLTPTIQNRLK